MSMPARELLILVPGAARMARGSQRERLVKGLITTSERVTVKPVDAGDVPADVVRLHATGGGQTHQIDVVEAYWNDLAPSMQNAGVRTKFVRGTSLLAYWAYSGVWRGFRNRKYLTLGLISAAVALITWYYGTAAMFVQALIADQTAPTVVKSTLGPILPIMTAIGTWKVWAAASLVMGMIPVNTLIDVLDLTKRYLTNERVDDGGIGLRMQIRRRVREQILAAIDKDDYSRVTVLGHSFGTVIATDVLADLPASPRPLRFVTTGSPIELLKRRAEWLPADTTTCLQRSDLTSWTDICSDGDWFASGSDLPEHAKVRSFRVPIEGTFVDQVSGRTHGGYFDRDEVINILVESPVAA